MKFLRSFAVFLFLAALCLANPEAERLFKAGQKAERSGDVLHAYLLYAKAAKLEPANVTYASRAALLRTRAEVTSSVKLDADPIGESDTTPANPAGGLNIASDLLEETNALPPPSLEGNPGLKSFDIKGDARVVFEKVAEAYGLMVVFDSGYQPTPAFRFRMDDATYQDAFRALEAQSDSFMVPVSSKLALIARDTAAKRTELEPVMAVAIPIPERMGIPESQEMVTAVQQALDLRRIRTDAGHRVIYMREQVSKINTARLMLAELSRLRPQVEVDVELISVDKTHSTDIGVTLPNSFPAVDLGSVLHSVPQLPNGISTFMSFGGGATMIGLGFTSAATLTAQDAKGDAATLLDSQIVAVDGQAATLHVGQRYPIISSAYAGTATGTGQVYAPPPTINYTDLGLVLKVTPSIHEDNEVTLDLESEFSVLGANSSVSGIPIVSSRKYTGKVRLKAGEWAVVAGLVQTTDADSKNGVYGLSNIPFIGRFFSQNHFQHDSSQVLLLLKPHLVGSPPWDDYTPPIFVGTETRPLTAFQTERAPERLIKKADNADLGVTTTPAPEIAEVKPQTAPARLEATSHLPRLLQAARGFFKKAASEVNSILAAARSQDQSAPRAERAATPQAAPHRRG